ncbi:TMEM165/GDT1 family protein [Paludibacterium yongneupense]|uniref:TMEM165/GDT1 family protein n=1 Tax=Paludibacterium yongneupense TaxID=400061 RepID=UPI00042A540A
MEAFLVSVSAITLGEIGDKTQLLALVLAARFKRPLPIVAGIVVAVVANHLLAGYAGHLLGARLSPDIGRWILGLSLLAVALWTLKPDTIDEGAEPTNGYGVFVSTCIAFFLAEMGDKTQIVTVLLAARFNDLLAVVAGTTLGMLIADLPAVFIGHQMADRLPLRFIRFGAAALFAVLGVVTLAGL